MTTTSDNNDLYKQIFFPYAMKALTEFKRKLGRFIYYTTAETAFQILKSQEIWMRSTLTMNDYMEVQHGMNCLREAYDSIDGENFNAALDACFTNISGEIRSLFNTWVPGFQRDTFVVCFSEHFPDDDNHGLLSMWRAYGGNSGIALVFNCEAMIQKSDALAAYISPVAYMVTEDVKLELKKITVKLEENREYIKELSRESIKNVVFSMLRFAVICNKHRAFHEEREWRVVSSPAIQSSPLLIPQTEVIGGVPQTVLKIKLKEYPEHGLHGLSLVTLLDRILIGPCEHPQVIWRALHQVLSDLNIREPEKKIFDTGIPLRPNQR